jgi:hypothetical protein
MFNWRLSRFESSVEVFRNINPRYNNSVSLKFNKDEGNLFFRSLLEGDIELVGSDYTYVESLPFREPIYLHVADSSGTLPSYKGLFFKTDCTFDQDNKSVVVKTAPFDDYRKILEGQNKTFNLSGEGLVLDSVDFYKKPLLQIYILGSSFVTNVSNGVSFTESIKTLPIHLPVSMAQFNFTEVSSFFEIPSTYAPQLGVDVTGKYTYNPNTQKYDSANFDYYVHIAAVPDTGSYTSYLLKRASNNEILYVGADAILNVLDFKPLSFTNFLPYDEFFSNNHSFNINSSNVPAAIKFSGETFTFSDIRIYGRFLTSALVFNGVDSAEVPEEDIVSFNNKYPRTASVVRDAGSFSVSNLLSVTPTEYNQIPERVREVTISNQPPFTPFPAYDVVFDLSPNQGKFYEEILYFSTDSTPVALCADVWDSVSVWLEFKFQDFEFEADQSEKTAIRNSFSLKSLISNLLSQVGSSVTFEEDSQNSVFFYDTVHPLGTSPYNDFKNNSLGTVQNPGVFFCPLSSFSEGDFTNFPAKVELKLKDVFDTLRDLYRVFWFVEDGKLRLEHLSWFQNGGTYFGLFPLIGHDTTTTSNLKNRKNWSFSQNKYSFDKPALPERFEFAWLYDVSPTFEGVPINVLSDFVEKGMLIRNRIGLGVSDVDFVQTGQGSFSNGLLMLNTLSNSQKETFFSAVTLNGRTSYPQNGFASMPFLQSKFYVSGMPSNDLELNGEVVSLQNNVSREKVQNITFPYVDLTDFFKLITTELGAGQLDSFTVRLDSFSVNATIKHDTE